MRTNDKWERHFSFVDLLSSLNSATVGESREGGGEFIPAAFSAFGMESKKKLQKPEAAVAVRPGFFGMLT